MRVLVTRPEPGASETARRLVSAGHEAIILPLTGIVPMRPQRWPEPGACDAVALSSANALRHSDGMPAGLLALPCFAVGDHTAKIARDMGFHDVRVAEGDASSLAVLCIQALTPGSTVVYPCGRVRKPELEASLRAEGIAVVAVETYDTAILPPRAAEEHALISRDFPAAVLFHSVLSVHAFAALVERLELRHRTVAVCLSARIASAAREVLRAEISIAEEPNDASMIACLGSVNGDAPPTSP